MVLALAITGCASATGDLGDDVGVRDGGAGAATCVLPIRFDGRVYTGVSSVAQPPTVALGLADQAECADVGEEAIGVWFPAEPRQIEAWAVDGFDPHRVISVRDVTGGFVVLVAKELPGGAVDRIVARLQASLLRSAAG